MTTGSGSWPHEVEQGTHPGHLLLNAYQPCLALPLSPAHGICSSGRMYLENASFRENMFQYADIQIPELQARHQLKWIFTRENTQGLT
jgi:hypothetical protein